MNFQLLQTKLKSLHTMNESDITTLYSLSNRSLFVLLILAALTTIGLYPMLHDTIVFWFTSLLLLVGYRVYSAYIFQKDPEKYPVDIWYAKFVVAAISTALIFSTIGFTFIHYVEHYYQLYIIAILLGLASGSIVSLSPDRRLNIIYAGILLIPLIITLLFLSQTPLNVILAISLTLYFLAQVTTILKIDAQKSEFDLLQSEHMLLDSLFKNAPLGIFTYNKDLEVLECNDQLNKLFKHSKESIVGMKLNHLPDRRILTPLQNAITQGPQAYVGPYTSLNGKDFWIDAKAFSFSDSSGFIGGVGMIEDKTKEHAALKELEYMVQHDVLTGLFNRRGFKNYIENLVNHKKHKTYFSILFYIDLNQFKSINDSLGHEIGDNVLLAVSKRLSNLLGKENMVSRLGGDEFVVIIPHISQEQDIAHQEAGEFSRQIQDIFLEPFIIREMHLHIKSSVGIVLIEPGYTNTTEIIRHADLSMYKAKRDNDHVSYYDSSLDQQQKDLFILQHDLGYAIKRDQLELYFQPIATIKEDKLRSAEALIRWIHPDKGVLSPHDFIPLAIKAGLLSQVTWWVLDSICSQIAKWKSEGHWNLKYVSINVNSQQLVENNFAVEFHKKLNEYGVDTKDIMIEITERSLIDNFNNTQDVINELRRKGVKCAIDDFGIGYSSLHYLKKLSFHTLKIDKAFIKDIDSNPKELHLLATILNIGRQFDYNIVIEGIEDEKQRKMLLKLDDKLRYQGFLYAKPLPAKIFKERFLLS